MQELVVESLVVSLAMVVFYVLVDETPQMPLAERDHACETLLFDRPDEPLGIGVEIGTFRRQPNRLNTGALQDLAKDPRIEGIAVVNQMARPAQTAIDRVGQIAGLLLHPRAARLRVDPGDGHAAGSQLDHEEDEVPPEPRQRQHLDGEQIAGRQALPVRLQERLPGHVPASLGRRVDSVGVQDPLHRGPGDSVAEVRERAADPRVAPPRIVDRHPDHELGDVLSGHWSTSTSAGAAIVFRGDQSPVPTQDRIRGDEARDLRQDPPAEFVTAHSESTTLGVRQAKRPRAQVFSEDPILLPEIVDQIVLVTVHPASEREDEELQRRRHSLRLLGRLDQHRPSLGRFFAPYAVEDDPEFDVKKAQKKLRRFVEGHDHAIRLKAEIMVDHFHEQVIAKNKIGGEARAMVVTNGIERTLQYFHAIRDYLQESKSQYRAVVAFSGEPEFGGEKVTEASLNGFPSGQIADKIQQNPYRFLICADKFQTGYDEPLLHTMYVDKTLSGIKAVQTLSRLNRAHPKKHDVFVLDFLNDADTIRDAFTDYYRATILAGETDPDKLHDLQADLDAAQVYSPEQIDDFVERYLDGAERDQLDPILDACVAVYRNDLDEDGQVDFKGKAKAFVRTYGFLSCVLPYTNAAWEKRSIFLNFLISKLPAPEEEDLSKGILDAIDMDSYRVEKRAVRQILLPDENAEIAPVPPSGGGHVPEPELERLSSILREFNDLFGAIAWQDTDRVKEMITETIPFRVAQDAAFKNARQNSD